LSRRDAAGWVDALVRPDVRAAAAYHVADARGMVKLDAMENPFPLPAGLRAALGERLAGAALNRYPDPRAEGLARRLRTAFGIDARWEIMLGNGSDEIIQIMIAALAGPDCCVLAPAPSFVMFRLISRWLNVRFAEVALAPDFGLDVPAMLAAIREHRPRLVFLACPNNPTGKLFDEAGVRAVVEAAEALVVIDEAYLSFASRSHAALLAEYPNLLVMRTLSKLGLAGLRLGYLFGDPRWIAEFDKIRLPYNIGTLNQVAAEVALEHIGELNEQAALIVAERGRLFARLRDDSRLQVWPSEANFLLVRPCGADARAVHAGMARRGVLVKCLDGAHPLLANCLRLTIGTPSENARALEALDGGLGEAFAGSQS
jgi:histidinol-phosphate aminotransferase